MKTAPGTWIPSLAFMFPETQPSMDPSSVAKMNVGEPPPFASGIVKPALPPKTWPVGPCGGVLPCGGTLTKLFVPETGSGEPTRGPVVRVERGRVGHLVRDPEGARRTERHPPGIFQVGVGHLCHTGEVRDEVGLHVTHRVRLDGRGCQQQGAAIAASRGMRRMMRVSIGVQPRNENPSAERPSQGEEGAYHKPP